MSQSIRKIVNAFQSDGLSPFYSYAKTNFLRILNPVYKLILPDFRPAQVGSSSINFDQSARSLHRPDFIDDIESESEIIKDLLDKLQEDDVFYDIGSNIGTYSCFSSDIISNGSVVAFEPNPENFRILQSNIAYNNIDADLYNIALSNEDGRQALQLRGQTGHQLSPRSRETTVTGNFVTVETRRGDNLVAENNIPSPTVCKIDVEGAEYIVLEGLKQTISHSDCRLIYCEVHPNKIGPIGGSSEGVERILTEAGYELSVIAKRRDNYFIRATKK